MRYLVVILALVAAVLSVASCAPRSTGVLLGMDRAFKVDTVYVWDADGHTDLKLLRGLKAEAEAQLASGGYIVSRDPKATGAYVKITVDEAIPGRHGFIKARLYIIEAAAQNVIYDKVCEVGSDAEGYPLARFMECALHELLNPPEEGG